MEAQSAYSPFTKDLPISCSETADLIKTLPISTASVCTQD